MSVVVVTAAGLICGYRVVVEVALTEIRVTVVVLGLRVMVSHSMVVVVEAVLYQSC